MKTVDDRIDELFPSMVKILKPGKKGSAKIDHYRPDKFDLFLNHLQGLRASNRKVVRLIVNEQLIMTDGDNEKDTNWEVVHEARGQVLIAGLGIGMILIPILQKREVKSVIVVEKNPDVITLVGLKIMKQFGMNGKLGIRQGDIFKWRPNPGEKFDVIYFDIWPVININNLPQMKQLRRAFESYKRHSGWIGSWCEDILTEMKYGRR